MNIESIARICHEVNRAYCQELGDYSVLGWLEAPEWQRETVRAGVDFHIMMEGKAKAAHSHESWMALKRDEGWVYGEVKNPEAKTHPCMVPFEELPVEQQAKDYIFKAIVDALA